MKILGLDEAGRGPVIGPLIIAGVMIDEETENEIKELKDSKLLKHEKRIEFDKKIKAISQYKIIEIWPQEIDEALKSTRLNLNWLEAVKQAEIINELNPDRVIIDCPSPSVTRFKDYLKNLLKNKAVELIVEHKADAKYKICSAASIIAKVRREEIMEELRKKYGDMGPGYSSNPITQKFVEENWNKYPEIFRKSWSTFKDREKKSKQRKLIDFED